MPLPNTGWILAGPPQHYVFIRHFEDFLNERSLQTVN